LAQTETDNSHVLYNRFCQLLTCKHGEDRRSYTRPHIEEGQCRAYAWTLINTSREKGDTQVQGMGPGILWSYEKKETIYLFCEGNVMWGIWHS